MSPGLGSGDGLGIYRLAASGWTHRRRTDSAALWWHLPTAAHSRTAAARLAIYPTRAAPQRRDPPIAVAGVPRNQSAGLRIQPVLRAVSCLGANVGSGPAASAGARRITRNGRLGVRRGDFLGVRNDRREWGSVSPRDQQWFRGLLFLRDMALACIVAFCYFPGANAATGIKKIVSIRIWVSVFWQDFYHHVTPCTTAPCDILFSKLS